VGVKWYIYKSLTNFNDELALFPVPCHFRLHEEQGGPGIFSPVRDVKGRKDLIECGRTGAQNRK